MCCTRLYVHDELYIVKLSCKERKDLSLCLLLTNGFHHLQSKLSDGFVLVQQERGVRRVLRCVCDQGSRLELALALPSPSCLLSWCCD